MKYRLEKYTLGEISVGNKGKYGIAASAVPYSDRLPTYLRITDINDDGTLNKNDLKSVKENRVENYILKKNDIVFARTGASVGRNYFHDNDKELVYAGFLIKFSIDEKKINPKIIKYYCQSDRYYKWIDSVKTGSTRPNINARTYAELPLILPKKEVQDKIVSIMDKIDCKIELNNRINDNLLEQAKILYKNWFIDYEPFSLNGNIPPNWKFGSVKDIIELHDSKRIPLSKNQRSQIHGDYPYYGATSIMDYVNDYIFDGVYLLLGEDGTVVDDYGYPILQYVNGKFWVNNHAHIITGKNGFTVELLYLLFSLTNVQSIVTGAVQKKISQKNLKNIPTVIPTTDILDEFNSIIQPIFSQIRNIKSENNALSTLRDLLLPKLMSGEVDVSNIEI